MDFLFDFVPSFFRCGFSAFGMGDWSLLVFFFSSRRLCRSCLAKIAFNRLCQLVSERSVGHPTTSFFLFFFLSFPRDRAARRNLSWCLFFFSFFLVQIFTTSIKSLRKIFRCLNSAKFKIESDIIRMILYLWLDSTRLHADILYLFYHKILLSWAYLKL